jgi:putative copper export protein
VLTFLIAFFIGSAPLWIGGLIVFFIVRAVIRNRKKKRAAAPATSQTPMDDRQA